MLSHRSGHKVARYSKPDCGADEHEQRQCTDHQNGTEQYLTRERRWEVRLKELTQETNSEWNGQKSNHE